MVKRHFGVGGYGLDPGFAAKAVLDVEVRRVERLGDEETLLSERSEKLRLPHSRVGVFRLAVASPVPVRIRQGEI